MHLLNRCTSFGVLLFILVFALDIPAAYSQRFFEESKKIVLITKPELAGDLVHF